MSSKSLFTPGKAIRGGVPIIFPWFGAREGGKPGTAHGFARSMEWQVEKTEVRSDGVAIRPRAQAHGSHACSGLRFLRPAIPGVFRIRL